LISALSDRLLEMVDPRYLKLSTTSRAVPSIVIEVGGGVLRCTDP
jgi:hypothetical protein